MEREHEEFERIFELAQQGDREAVGELLQPHLDGLRAYVRLKSGRLLRERVSASDLVQSACREALHGLESIECHDEGAFRAWLYRVALHKVLGNVDHLTAQRRSPDREVDFADSPDRLLEVYKSVCTPSRQAIAREQVARIEAAFDQLPDEQREVILLSRFEGLAHREIALRMDRSEASVRQLLSRGRARLAMLLDEAEQADDV